MFTTNILITITIFLLAALLCKVIKVHVFQYTLLTTLENQNQHFLQLFHQIQAFNELNQELNLHKSLPPLGGWAASADFLLVLSEHAKKTKPTVVVECSSGASTIVLARCMQLNARGHVYSLEHDLEYAEKTRKELQKHNLDEWATIIDAPLMKYTIDNNCYEWYTLPNNLPLDIDMLVIDGPPGNLGRLARYPAGPLLMTKIDNPFTCFVDDANRTDELEMVNRWASEMPALEIAYPTCEKGCAKITNNLRT